MIKQLLALFGIGLVRLTANDDELFLKAISAVESGDNDAAISKSGARGRYQIMPATWRQHSTEHFSLAHDHKTAKGVALKHVVWLRKELDHQLKEDGHHLPAHYFQIAMAWKAGENYRGKERDPADLEYAVRVLNIFNDLKYRKNHEAHP